MKLHPGSWCVCAVLFLGRLIAAPAGDLPPPLKEQQARAVQTLAAYFLAAAEQNGLHEPELVTKALEASTTFLQYHADALAGAKTLEPRYRQAFDFAKHVSTRTRENSRSIRDTLELLVKTQSQSKLPSRDFCFGVMEVVAKSSGIAELAPPSANQLWSYESATHAPDPEDVRYASFRLCSAFSAVADALVEFATAHDCELHRFADEAEPDFARYKTGG